MPDPDSELLAWDDSVSPARLIVRGDWTLDNYAALGRQIARFRTDAAGSASMAGAQDRYLDLRGLGAVDTAGASRLFELLGVGLIGKISDSGLSPERNALLQTVATAMSAAGEVGHAPRRPAGIVVARATDSDSLVSVPGQAIMQIAHTRCSVRMRLFRARIGSAILYM